jgi:hypothetical protein
MSSFLRVYVLALLCLGGLSAQSTNPLAWSRYLPGGVLDVATSVAVERGGDVWVAGHSNGRYEAYGPNEPYQLNNGGGSDVFLVKFRIFPDGTALVLFFTWLGGSGDELLSDMKLDNRGRVVLTGTTASSNFPIGGSALQTTFGGDIDSFVAIIDPTQGGAPSLAYGSYYGAAGREFARSVAIGPTNNIVIAGNTIGDDIPGASGGAQPNRRGNTDVFVVYFNPEVAGIAYASYLGGAGNDTAVSVALGENNRICFAGSTSSDDAPLTDGVKTSSTGYLDGYVGCFDPNANGLASFVYGSLIGGSGSDELRGIGFDPAGNIVVSGITFSTDLQVTPNAAQSSLAGGTDLFLMKVDPRRNGPDSVLYSTYLGGTGFEFSYGFSLIDANRVAVAGYSMSGALPTTANALRRAPASAFADGMLGVLDMSRTGGEGVEYLSYFGGASTDVINGIAFDPLNPRNLFIAGYTTSPDLPTTDGSTRPNAPGAPNAFTAKIVR